VQPEPDASVRDDGVTMGVCAACGRAFPKQGRGRFCDGACRQAAWRRRKATVAAMPPESHPALLIIYECTVCEGRYVGQRRCPDCNLFNRRVGLGGPCPHCLFTELLRVGGFCLEDR